MEAWKIELYYGNVIDYHELYHYGTKGQKWGERHWQNPDGTFNEAGKQRYFGKGSGENYHSVKSGGSGKTSSKAENNTAKREITKEELLKSTDPKFIYEHRDKLTTAELQDRLNRIRSEKELGRLAKNGKSFSDKYISKAKKGNEIVRETAATVRTAKIVYKALAIIGGIAVAKIADFLIPNGSLDIHFG